MSNLNWVDYIFLAIFFLSTLAGFGRGFVKEIFSLITIVAAFVIASLFASPVAALFTGSSSVQSAVNNASTSMGVNAAQPVSYAAIGVSYTLLFVGTIIVGSIVGYVLNIAFQAGILGLGNRLLGAAFGFIRGFIINLVIIFVVQLTPMSANASWHASTIVNTYQPAVEWLGGFVSPALAGLKERFGNTLQNVNSTINDGINRYKSGSN